MIEDSEICFNNCLYFTISKLARTITKMAEEEFSLAGVAPSQAFILMVVNENPGATQKEISGQLNLAPSTMTRFVDSLVQKGLLERKAEKKNALIFPTPRGRQMQPLLEQTWHNLYERYTSVLGEETSSMLTDMLTNAAQKLES
jgi:DNA-binding MarR family transcriptional regulator